VRVAHVWITSHQPDLDFALDPEVRIVPGLLQVISQALQGVDSTVQILAAASVELALLTSTLIRVIAVRIDEVDLNTQAILQWREELHPLQALEPHLKVAAPR
jgi:hypothetical protein